MWTLDGLNAVTPATVTKALEDHSLPVVSGYSIRSRSIVEAQQKLGHRVQVITGTAHQLDDPTAHDTVLNGIPYARTAFNNKLCGRAIAGRWPLLRSAARGGRGTC